MHAAGYVSRAGPRSRPCPSWAATSRLSAWSPSPPATPSSARAAPVSPSSLSSLPQKAPRNPPQPPPSPRGSCRTLAAAKRARASTHDVDRQKNEVKFSLVARVGKVLFLQHGGSPVSLDAVRRAAEAGEQGYNQSQIRKSFCADVPGECLEHMEQTVVKMMGLESDPPKEHYLIKILDKYRRDSTISCKCTVHEDGKLAIHKVELDQAEVANDIESFVSSAIVDPDVKGGLRWPLGKESIGGRFSVVGVWHKKYKAFRNEDLRFRLRYADRFHHRSSVGEVSNEVSFKLIGISKRLEEGNQEADTLKQRFQSALRMIWDSALNYKTRL